MEEPVAAVDAGVTAEEIKPYRIHVSSRYLNLTKQKLEIARLPREFDEPKSQDWWQPKSQIEPLIDFWLEQYQWRDQEEILNKLPQFRTGFTIPQSKSPIRLHFIHARSPRANVIPLLLIPPFPFCNLSLGHLIGLFTEPAEANHQPFHLVIPSLPGLGFSDRLPTNSPAIPVTADLLDALMKRLGYPFYLATNAGAGNSSPAQIDYRLADWLSTQYPDSCLGTHLISPPLARPTLGEAPLRWAKWSIACTFGAPIWGYNSEDFSAREREQQYQRQRGGHVAPSARPTGGAGLMPNGPGLMEPNTLAYALCDSPTGLLVSMMGSLRMLAPGKEFTPTEMINFTQLAWLPGPEAAMRFWAYCSRHPEDKKRKSGSGGNSSASKPRVAVTVFLGSEEHQMSQVKSEDGCSDGAFDKVRAVAYSCPGWAKTRYRVVYTNRAGGESRLLAWERPEIIAAGVRGLAAAVLRVDRRLEPSGRPAPEPAPAPAPSGRAATTVTAPGEQQQQPQQQQPSTPESSGPQAGFLAPPKATNRLPPVREVSDDTKVGSNDSLEPKVPSPTTATPSPTQSPDPPPAVKVEAS